ncbi:MAG TPA: hypothetical protein VFH43_10950 [Candidatus Kapabacteria bacterium]|nr:hypothetical protein [Candidatus Kapabacteria bacterium]
MSLSILLLSVSIASAQEQRTFFSPGLKFGYEWGHGLFAGIELSYTIMPRDAYAFTYGASLNFDLMRDGAWKAHLGAQGGHAVGVQIGPTYYKEKDAEGRLGYSFTAFSLVTLMPYYTYTDLFGKKINESGVLLKIPLQTSGPKVGDLFKT